jgi:hypothetical protein
VGPVGLWGFLLNGYGGSNNEIGLLIIKGEAREA